MREKGKAELTVGFVGNPNCGKTTLFNGITGASAKAANWPGVTVERMEGEVEYAGRKIKLTDLPGIYSLNSYSLEEKVSKQWLMEGEADIIVNVADASNLEKSLYLTLQLLEMNIPVILVLNMMDVVEKRKIKIDFKRLSEMLGGIRIVPVSARKKAGIGELMKAICSIETRESRPFKGTSEDTIRKIIKACVTGGENHASFTEKADFFLIHWFWGLPVFLVILAFVFFLTFTVGDFFKKYFETGFAWISLRFEQFLLQAGTEKWLVSLITDGILAGVGGVLVFLPNIMCLFLALAILEDSGYMARVAYIMDDIMATAGLSGKAFLPMILGFGCTVPAVMAARTLENDRDRKRTILIIPFMSCSARLPVYILFSSAFFGKNAPLAAYSLYIFGTVAALFVACTVNRFVPEKEKKPLIMELPDYRMPDGRTVFVYVKEKVRDYLTKAGTTIFLASVFLWLLLHLGKTGMVSDVSESFGAVIGHGLVPVLIPAGLGIWQLAVALICGLSAKEMVVSGCSVLFGIENINSPGGLAAFSKILGNFGFGPLNAYAFMIFCLLYTPCTAAAAVIRRETHSLRWTAGLMGFQLVFAWGITVLFFQVGNFFLG